MKFETGKLRGKKVAVLAADGFEYVELIVPRRALRLAGAAVDVVSLHAGRIRGMNLTQPTRTVRVDRTLDGADPTAYDALLLPGGLYGPDFLRQSHKARMFVAAFDAANKPIAALCHGPWLLVSAELVGGRILSSWPGIRDDIVHAGGIWRDEPLVRDGNWVTSRSPQDFREFVPGMIDLFAAAATARIMPPVELPEGALISSPKHDEPPRLAVAAARILPGPTFRTLAGAAAATALAALAIRRVALRVRLNSPRASAWRPSWFRPPCTWRSSLCARCPQPTRCCACPA
jgi:protease I